MFTHLKKQTCAAFFTPVSNGVGKRFGLVVNGLNLQGIS
jgi:hypothetical protein